ncbi:fatty acyl-AMP ligase [Nodularia harveyana UHCC-0300]|uniref:Fatty acyl-AMP ligase n=1 Tax=Nodularia harveyana UHCC-0300 TaxID=2974287 RepID=A0A9E7VDE0_9CYAN|nr:fatty acyl-AMP ligase [Nodularia harveyana]MEA5581855.1 fatty acyl-AMP ligase [Nodularia harveyana UHCC-0300]UZC80151.1 PuwC [Nodularia harveyana UHCC-0300]
MILTDSQEAPVLSNQFSTLVELLQYRAKMQGSKTAFTFLQNGEVEAGSFTYGTLAQQAQAIASQLQITVKTGDRALLLYPSGLEFIAAFFGCLYAGVVAVPAYPPRRNQKLSRLEAIITDSQAQVILTTKSLLPQLQEWFSENTKLAGIPLLATDDCDSLDWEPPQLSRDSLAFLQYTSGSTGTPKGVMVSHGNLLHNSEYIKQACKLSSASVSVSWLPNFHDMGLIDGILQPFYTGFLGVLMPPASFVQQPIRWLQAISKYRATHCGGPNFGYDLCTKKITSEQIQELDLSSWLDAYCGAEPINQATVEKFTQIFQPCGFRRRAFYPCYGLAEATVMVSGGLGEDEPVYCAVEAEALENNRVVITEKEGPKVKQFVGCGRVWLDGKIAIANPETLTQCPPDEIGEIWVSGASIAGGYWQRLEETQQTFHAYLADTGAGPFLRTGDLGFLLDGELFITGRMKDVMIIRGRNHYPQDIELTVEQSHPALRTSFGAAFTVKVNEEEKLVIVQEVERTWLRKLEGEEVIIAIRKAITQQHELQVYSIFLIKTNTISKTSSGKIQRRLCREKLLENNLEVLYSDNKNLISSS